MSKKRAILKILKYICGNGANPDNITPFIKAHVVDGVVDTTEFKRITNERIDPGRWFCGDDELLHANEKTYAFNNQWGTENWYKAMERLKDEYQQFNIEFSPASPVS